MKTILITGGASGLGRGIARHYLANGYRVIAVGNSARNGKTFCSEGLQFGAGTEKAVFIQADLSLISENKRLIEEIKNNFPTIDMLIFCASRHCNEYSETAEGLEFSFALDYLSRFLLSYGLKECLERTDNPVIMNICGTGMKGQVNWEDLQNKDSFNPMKVMMHGSRLNELSAVAFAEKDTVGKIKYVLYNPMAVQTPGMMEFGNGIMKLYYKFAAKSIESATVPIVELLNNPLDSPLSAFKERKTVSLELPTFNKENAIKLYELTTALINNQ